jgi:hypothetical protein
MAVEKYYSPAELKERLSLSVKTVIRQFEGRPGVIVIGHPETTRPQ